MAISSSLSASLSAYTDKIGQMTVIAPRGWRCSALIGADGSEGITVFPPGTTTASPEAIRGIETSACYGCTTGQACALFPAAARAWRASFHSPCPAHRPAAESVDRLSATVVAFEDPAFVKGER